MLRQLREHGYSYGPSVQNTSGSTLEKHRVARYTLAGAPQAVEVATGPADLLAGMTAQQVLDGEWCALKIQGVVIATAGALVVAGDRLVPATGGKLIPATTGQEWCAVAMTSAAADGDLFEAALRLSGGAVLP